MTRDRQEKSTVSRKYDIKDWEYNELKKKEDRHRNEKWIRQ